MTIVRILIALGLGLLLDRLVPQMTVEDATRIPLESMCRLQASRGNVVPDCGAGR